MKPTNDTSAGDVEHAVDVVNISRRFGRNLALRDVSLQVPRGSVFGLLGTNGAGKTTLIRHIMGLLRPQTGHVRVLKRDPVDRPETHLQDIGYMTEEDSLPGWMVVRDMLEFCESLYKNWDRAYADQLMRQFDLPADKRLSNLSKGQRARVGLLAAIAHRPQLLILDEPSSGLDPIARGDILQAVIRTISQDGRTVLFSSHLLEEIERVCDQVAVMNEGRLLETIATSQLQQRYVELTCMPNETWTAPPDHQGVVHWDRAGEEWSAILDTSQLEFDSLDQLPAMLPVEWGVHEVRTASMLKWFRDRK
ncbi:MAG: ABC transporter ATP-binding protein, partial [Planctomycetota bacterium]